MCFLIANYKCKCVFYTRVLELEYMNEVVNTKQYKQ